MSTLKIEIINASVQYRTYSSASRSLKVELLKRSFTANKEKYSLENLDLEINSGEIVGVVGRNGAGKSTLTRLIMGIVRPTTGRVVTRGSIVGILQLGCGLNLDLTGYENIEFMHLLRGQERQGLDRVMNDVSDWTELGNYLHEPLRTYSSGMLARYSFALETSYKPDILVIDEILSVGDFVFQKKSNDRMKSLITSGTTVVIVSHDLSTISELCSRCVWIEEGRLVMDGVPDKVLSAYKNS